MKKRNLILTKLGSLRIYSQPFLILFLLFRIKAAWSTLPETVKQTLEWELNANSFGKAEHRSADAHFKLYHYDIPLSMLSKSSYMENLNPQIRKSLIYKNKSGVEVIRWIINPEDTLHAKKLAKFLTSKGVDATPKHFFTGHLTASRSMYVEAPNAENPDQPIIFSGKVSTNRTGGRFKGDKSVDKDQVVDSYTSTRLAQKVQKNGNVKFSNLVLLQEPAGFVIEGKSDSPHWFKNKLEQGFIIRDIAPIAEGKKFYLPGFSVFHEKVGRNIAALNGSNNPKEFWTEHYIKPLGKAAAELTAYMGLSMTSAHNQQWLVELDENKKPTGKIALRDFNDSHIFTPFYEQNADQFDNKTLKTWDQRSKYVRDYLRLQLGIFHGTAVPSWIKKSEILPISEEFFKSFDKKFSKITGITHEELSAKKTSLRFPPKYSFKDFNPRLKKHWTKGWRQYYAVAPCFRGRDFIMIDGEKMDCKDVLKEISSQADRPYSIIEDVKDLSCQLQKKGNLHLPEVKNLDLMVKRLMRDGGKKKERKSKLSRYLEKWSAL